MVLKVVIQQIQTRLDGERIDVTLHVNQYLHLLHSVDQLEQYLHIHRDQPILSYLIYEISVVSVHQQAVRPSDDELLYEQMDGILVQRRHGHVQVVQHLSPVVLSVTTLILSVILPFHDHFHHRSMRQPQISVT
jgi:hypothetical protein